MPQLSLETFVTQYFWLIVFLFNLYYSSATLYLPTFSGIFKVRSFLDSVDTFLLDTNFSLKTKTLLSHVFQKSAATPVSLKYDSVFLNINHNWVATVQ